MLDMIKNNMKKRNKNEYIKEKRILLRWKLVAIISLILLLLDIALYVGIKQYYPDVWEKDKKVFTQNMEALQEQKTISDASKDIEINSQYALLYDVEDGRTLYEKNADETLYPASLTKVLTAIVASDAIGNMQETSTITDEDLSGLMDANASVAGFNVGDKLSYEQALYALILPSGADAANFLGNHLSGSVVQYVEEMNKKAQALGMINTNFANPTGLHEDNHYTTLEDMKKMMILGWKNPVFKKVMTTLRYEVDGLASHPDGLNLKSSLLSYGEDLSFQGGEIIGGKSGYTLEAQCCLISIAKMDDGHMYIFISAKASGEPMVEKNHLKDAKEMYEAIATARLSNK